MSRAGPKLSRIVTNTDVPVEGALALMTTPFDCKSASSVLLLANSGISVEKTDACGEALSG